MTFEQLKEYAYRKDFGLHERWYKNVNGKMYQIVNLVTRESVHRATLEAVKAYIDEIRI